MSRTEYYNDPAAPEPNSLVVGVSVAVFGDHGGLLMQRRVDNNLWALPGGAMDMSESVAQAGIRETLEETGLQVEITGIVGIYTDPAHIIEYSDGEVRRQFNICLRGRITGGLLRASSESTEVAFIPPGQIDDLPMHHTQRLRITHAINGAQSPHIG